jgi:hypothetical protein
MSSLKQVSTAVDRSSSPGLPSGVLILMLLVGPLASLLFTRPSNAKSTSVVGTYLDGDEVKRSIIKLTAPDDAVMSRKHIDRFGIDPGPVLFSGAHRMALGRAGLLSPPGIGSTRWKNCSRCSRLA